MGGAKAPPISRVVPSHRRSVAQLFRRTDVPTCRSPDTPQSRCSGPSVVANQSLKPKTSEELKPKTSELQSNS